MIQQRNGPPGSPSQAGRPKVEVLAKGTDALSVAVCGDIDPVAVIDAHRLWPLVLTAYARGWDDCLDRLADAIGGRIMPAQPTELEIRRWGPGGREHFGDPRPGDFQGRGGEAA
jgi:hypothetical protein